MRIFGVRHVMFVNAQGLDDFTYGPQQPITSFGALLRNEALIAIGPLPRTAAGKEYIIVGVDYDD